MLRRRFQQHVEDEFTAVVEQRTGRKVRAFISGIDTAVDGLSVEAFMLHPVGYDGPSREEIRRCVERGTAATLIGKRR